MSAFGSETSTGLHLFISELCGRICDCPAYVLEAIDICFLYWPWVLSKVQDDGEGSSFYSHLKAK